MDKTVFDGKSKAAAVDVKSADGMRSVAKVSAPVKPWTYEVATGDVFHWDTGAFVFRGYSGKNNSLNKPQDEHLKGLGPIPRGLYTIGQPRTSERTGRFVLDLLPLGHKAQGRSGFQIHGDNKNGDFSASQGCIVLGPKERSEISNGSPLIAVV